MNDRCYNNDGRRFHGGDRSFSHPPPAPGAIWEGQIQRIQPYGAFCSFGPLQQHRERRAWQGLIHISQLSETRVEKVDDVVDVDDNVWVKVLEVEKQDPVDYNRDNDQSQHAQPRYRIKLSMKDVSQDGTGEDLGREREAKEQITTQLETNLNSMIGMGVALDPMERLVLKKNSYGSGSNNKNRNIASSKTTFRGGYTLVDDDEGEPKPDTSTAVTVKTNSAVRTAPMGRGRGATLPAWMTSTEGPVGASSDPKKSQVPRGKNASDNEIDDDDKYRDHSDDDDDCSRQRSSLKNEKKKKDRKRRKKKSRHRDRRRDDRDGKSSDTSDSENSRIYDSERRHHKRRKSSGSGGSHRRKDHRNVSSKKRDKKKRKLSRHRDNHEKDNDRDYKRSESDSNSSSSSR
jgi:predicted RNA-binding protein with RPS1 domain